MPGEICPYREFMQDNIKKASLDAALLELKSKAPRRYEAIALIYLQDKSCDDASQATGVNKGALRVAVHHGLKRLRAKLQTIWKP